MIQKSHFWVYSQRKWKQDPGKVAILPYLFQLIHNSEDMETTQVSIKDEWMKKWWYIYIYISLVVQLPSHVRLCDPMDCSTSGLPVPHHLLKFAHVMSIASMMSSSHLILWHHLFPLPSIFASTRDFSNELVIHIRWPSNHFTLSISPSSDYSGLISLKTDWFDFLVVQETLRSLLQLRI